MLKNGLIAMITPIIMAMTIKVAAPANRITFVFFFIIALWIWEGTSDQAA